MIVPLQIQNDAMAEWIFRREQGCCAWLGPRPWQAQQPCSRLKAICPNAMRSFWKVAAFRLTESIRIQSGRRALRCFQNELHHFIILSLKWYYLLSSYSVVKVNFSGTIGKIPNKSMMSRAGGSLRFCLFLLSTPARWQTTHPDRRGRPTLPAHLSPRPGQSLHPGPGQGPGR